MVQTRVAPGQHIATQDPELHHPYRLYVPTSYYHERRWPLVVTCHGTEPFDTADLQLDEWKGLAEQKGFLVVAPELIDSLAQRAYVALHYGFGIIRGSKCISQLLIR